MKVRAWFFHPLTQRTEERTFESTEDAKKFFEAHGVLDAQLVPEKR